MVILVHHYPFVGPFFPVYREVYYETEITIVREICHAASHSRSEERKNILEPQGRDVFF